MKDQYRFAPTLDLIDAYARAVLAFAKTDQKAFFEAYQVTVLPLLRAAFEVIRSTSSLSFNPDKLAQAELAWWVARRQEDSCNAEVVGEINARKLLRFAGGRKEKL